jgi:hypothetical protein
VLTWTERKKKNAGAWEEGGMTAAAMQDESKNTRRIHALQYASRSVAASSLKPCDFEKNHAALMSLPRRVVRQSQLAARRRGDAEEGRLFRYVTPLLKINSFWYAHERATALNEQR